MAKLKEEARRVGRLVQELNSDELASLLDLVNTSSNAKQQQQQQQQQQLETAIEEGASADDYWAAPSEMLPSRCSFEAAGGPMRLWSSEEISETHCARLISLAERNGAEIREVYHGLVAPTWAAGTDRMGSALEGLPAPTFAEFELAVATVASRAFGGDGAKGQGHMLVPIVDQANHDHPKLVNTAKAMAPWGDFVVVASKAIKKGEEVKVTYGSMPNRQLLSQFGFLLPDDASIKFDDEFLAGSNAPFVDFMAAVAALPTEEGRGGATTEQQQQKQQSCLEELCVRGVLQRAAEEAAAVQKVGPLLQEAAAALGVDYVKLLENTLSSYPTSMEEDEAELRIDDEPSDEGGKDNENPAERERMAPRRRMSVQFRADLKRKLKNELARIAVE